VLIEPQVLGVSVVTGCISISELIATSAIKSADHGSNERMGGSTTKQHWAGVQRNSNRCTLYNSTASDNTLLSRDSLCFWLAAGTKSSDKFTAVLAAVSD